MSPTARMRSVLAGALGAFGGVWFHGHLPDPPPAAMLPVVALFAAAPLAQWQRLGAQAAARSAWWAALILALLLVTVGGHPQSRAGLVMAFACGAALLVADRSTLRWGPVDAGRPAAFAGTVQLLMVLALADAQTFGLFAGLDASGPAHDGTAVAFAAFAGAYVLAFAGLLRLAWWGVAVGMVTAASVGGLVLSGVLRAEREVVPAIVALCAVQLLVPLPMLISIATRRTLPGPSPRVRSAVATGVVGVMLVVCAVAFVCR